MLCDEGNLIVKCRLKPRTKSVTNNNAFGTWNLYEYYPSHIMEDMNVKN